MVITFTSNMCSVSLYLPRYLEVMISCTAVVGHMFTNSIDRVSKAEECICWREIDCCGEVMESVDRSGDCITLHPGFSDVCVNSWGLHMAGINL